MNVSKFALAAALAAAVAAEPAFAQYDQPQSRSEAQQGDQVRVSSPSKDELQDAIRVLREKDFGIAIHFGNYR